MIINSKDNKIEKLPDNSFICIINDINKGYEHLLTYFNTVKSYNINLLLSLINSIESSYEESYNRNMSMLSSLQILLDNYDGTIEKKNNILDHKINIYKCEENADIEELIRYYNEYNIIEKINIEKVKCIKTITGHTSNVNSLLLLKDKRIASCSADKTIRIYDPSNDYHFDQVIERHSSWITSICELDDGTIVSCSKDQSIMIGDYFLFNDFCIITMRSIEIISFYIIVFHCFLLFDFLINI